ncbi:MAG TPA: glycosyltransferase [Luteibaculaceae bacterium]|nr:glycosyltransferase [Luteibaculaceae bacterium]
MSKLSVVFLNTFSHGGGAALAASRLREALASKAETKLLVGLINGQADDTTFAFKPGKWGKALFWFRFIRERIYFARFEKDKTVRFSYSTASAGANLSSHEQIKKSDIVHLHWINFGFASIRALTQLASLNKPVVWTLHDMWLLTGGCHHNRGCENYRIACGNCQYLKNPAANDLSHRVWLKKKTALDTLKPTLVVPSEWLKNKVQESSLLKHHRVEIIGNAIDTAFFKPTANRTETEGWSEGEEIAICFIAANVSNPFKGATYLKEALEYLTHTHPALAKRIKLVVVGDDKNHFFDEFPILVHKTGFIHNPDEIVKIYQQSTLFILPSLEENLPNTIMEAMACGTPSVAFDVGGVSDMIQHQQNGYLARCKDAKDLANGIIWCTENTERYKQLCAQARVHIETNYSYPVIAEKHLNLYHSLHV